MERSERSLSKLGRHVATLQDQAPEARLEIARGRARLAEAVLYPASRPTRPFVVRIGVSLAAAALLIGAVFAVVRWPRASLQFEVGTGGAGASGEWIAAPPGAEVPIRFSDGSRLSLAPGGRARVAKVDADGAEVALETGVLALSIVHRDRTRWAVLVGPFRVRVVGTRFETRWDPATEKLTVALREGEVSVSGPVVGEARAIRAGEQVTVSLQTGTLEERKIEDESPAPAQTAESKGAAPTGQEAPPESPSSSAGVSPAEGPKGAPKPRAQSSAASTAAPAERGWRALAREAKYKDALAAAEREGFDGVCAGAGAADLRALGDAARLGGSPARAVQAFTALRSRFPGTAESAAAAFLLGRIAQDQRGDPAGAARWFSLYLSERPSGELAEEAAGRLVEAEDKRGDLAAARRAAERYLAAYPTGAHSSYAKGVLARAASPTP